MVVIMSQWVTGSALLTQAGAVLKTAVASFPAYWTTIADLCALSAQNDLMMIMGSKGYSADQLEDWDYKVQYCTTQGLYRLGGQGGGYGDYDSKWFEQFDLCKKDGILDRLGLLVIDGEIVPPDNSSGIGGVAGGRVDGVKKYGRQFDRLNGNHKRRKW